ncbi:MAG: GDP-mannose 4,6-dehydratase [Candidatus Eisenbacteria sp.]|nr:GDP-mannose 4,6-dehydratase [Candidatus Eisenbacteria bacterium]
MRALVTGGAGFIGSHLVEGLLKRGAEVSVIDDLSTGSFDNIAHLEDHPGFQYTIDTILDEEVMARLADGVDVIFHLAAAVGVKYVIENMLKALQINIRGTEIVLDVANRQKTKVVLFSSSEVYGKANSLPFHEEHDRLLGPTTINRWSYAAAKAIDEILALAYHREKKLPMVIVRCFNTCGPRQTGQYGMVIPRFVKQCLLGNPITIYGDGKQTRCFTAVADVVRAVLDLAEHDAAVGEIFNVGSESEIAIEDLAGKIKKMTGSSSTIDHIPYEKAYEQGFQDMRRRVPDLKKIRELIKYRPEVSLDEILESVIRYFEA